MVEEKPLESRVEKPEPQPEELKQLHKECAGCAYQQSGRCTTYLFQNQGLPDGKPLFEKSLCPAWIKYNHEDITETASKIAIRGIEQGTTESKR